MHNSTIEPRLIALLNDEPPPPPITYSRLDLPPLQDPNVLKANGRPHVLEPTTHTSNHKDERSTAKRSSQKISQILFAEPATISGNKNAQSFKDNQETDRALGLSSPQSLRKILQLDDEPSAAQRSPSKKRQRVDASGDIHKDDFVQLPQPQPPPKKQRAPKQVVPPIIIGLFEPPPNAALFPPIASSAFHDSHGRNTLNVPTEKGKEKEKERRITIDVRSLEAVNAQLSTLINRSSNGNLESIESNLSKKTQNRKKWTELETNQLLLGVHKYGIGKWKSILNDPLFHFNDRKPTDLKDRFRTCCPAEVQGQLKNGGKPSNESLNAVEDAVAKETPSQKSKSTSSLMSENILIGDESIPRCDSVKETIKDNPAFKKRSHRRELSDLASLGISGPLPFKKSSRKERRLFTEEEDTNILKGYNIYGPQWAKIQADQDLGLKDRRSTDIRDRFRNRWKGVYEGLSVDDNAKAGNKPASTVEPTAVSNIVGEGLGNGEDHLRSAAKPDSTKASGSRKRAVNSFPPLALSDVVGSSEKPKRGHSFQDLMTLSSNSISNTYPPTQTCTLPGKEIFYQLPNPISMPLNTANLFFSSSINSDSIFASSNESPTPFSENNPSDLDHLLAPFNANDSGMGVDEIVENFNGSSMDISRFIFPIDGGDLGPLK